MDTRHEGYCLTDPFFYDTPHRAGATAGPSTGDPFPGGGLPGDTGGDFAQARWPVPDAWTRYERGPWVVCLPGGAEPPAQGWQIHVSACPADARDVLDALWDHCVPRRIAFAFLRGAEALFDANGKYAAREASGTFATVHPVDEAALERALTGLDRVLRGRPGPYVPGGLRWASGPLYVRYGGFARRYCASPTTGETVPAIEDGAGRLVPETRTEHFEIPGWVTLPAFLAPHAAAERAGRAAAGLPYRAGRALHLSNGGGLYAGQDARTGERVVLKEARPYAGLTPDGADAVTRLHRERATLERLAGLDCVPALRDHLALADRHVLVEEFIEGQPLTDVLRERYPLAESDGDDTAAVAYTSWAVDLAGRVERAVAAVHARGVVLGDVHPSNILVRPDGRVVLIDFEGAADAAEERPQLLAAPGFAAPEDRTGPGVDHYALACLRLHMFMPLTPLIGLDTAKAGHLAAEARRVFPVPAAFLERAVRVITGDGGGTAVTASGPLPQAGPGGWPRIRESLAAAVADAATPDRDDRLFPGDIEQFRAPGGGLGIAYGAAGVLYALDVTGAGHRPEHEEWLVRHALGAEPGTRPGFYDGLHGVAYVLDRLGHRDEALRVLARCTGEDRWRDLGLGLHGGLAGIGLNLRHFAAVTGDPAFHDAAMGVAREVAARLGPAGGVPGTSGGGHPHAGLMRGSSGPALLFVRLYEHTGDPAFLDLAATALDQDLRRCVVRRNGGLHVNEGWRTVPYLAEGSAGIGLVLDDYLAHRAEDRFVTAAAEIRRAASAQFSAESGLFRGTAGMILHLSRAHPPGTAAERDPELAGHVRHLSRQALTHRGHLVFPGERLLRLSLDLATGNAGVLLALGAAFHDAPVHLPFLARPAAPSPVTPSRTPGRS
ncbi:class III lanthionine synthetase LanKC [Streptomyces sp. NPDC047821]|uniref:class III lanthionine synthetase LanKC n=1 Tax=Streptomyces sp. NPDC047821 TaxID=3365488 RepID=UPI00371BD491